MNAATFLYRFAQALPETFADLPRPASIGERTSFVAKRLHKVAQAQGKYCCCLHAPHAKPNDPNDKTVRGAKIQLLWDFTWYAGADLLLLPDVVIAYEGSGQTADFLRGVRKMLMGAAPLRVLIGYAAYADTVGSVLNMIDHQAKTGAWAFPPGTEDLILAGHSTMEPRGFRVRYRRESETTFEDIGLLGQLRFGEA